MTLNQKTNKKNSPYQIVNFNKVFAAMFGQESIITIQRIYLKLNLTPRDAMVLGQCVFWCNKSTHCTVENEFFIIYEDWQKEIEIKERTLRRSLKRLEEKGFISIKIKTILGAPRVHVLVNLDFLYESLDMLFESEKNNKPINVQTVTGTNVALVGQSVRDITDKVSETYIETEDHSQKNTTGYFITPLSPLPVDNLSLNNNQSVSQTDYFQAKDNDFSVFEDPRPIPQCPSKDERPIHQPPKKPEKGPKNIKNILDEIKVPLKTSFEAEKKAIGQRSQKSSANVAGQEIIEKNNANGAFKSAEEKNKEIDKIKQILPSQELKPAASPHIGVPFRCLDKEPTNEQRFVAKFNKPEKNLSAKKDYPVTKRLQELTQNLNDEQLRSFEYFWELYPMKKNKYLSMVSWFEHDCHEKVVDILYKLQAQIKEDHHFKSGMIPNPENYISTFRWEDEIWKPKNPKEIDWDSHDWALKENYGLLD